ncbi:Uncharacterised protein [Mycobacteroides abscessus subsp. massiliense]|nr:Uncharacterised protein [Mycobacteroides abscessus subsp. massiliense]
MILGIDRHPHSCLIRLGAQQLCIFQSDALPVARQRLSQRGQLERDLQRAHTGVHGIAALCQRIQQRQVRRHRAGGLLAVGGVLTEIVNGDESARIKQPGAGTEYIVLRFTGDEAANHLSGQRHAFGGVPQPGRSAGRQDGRSGGFPEPFSHPRAPYAGIDIPLGR